MLNAVKPLTKEDVKNHYATFLRRAEFPAQAGEGIPNSLQLALCTHLAMGQNLWLHFGVDEYSFATNFDVHQGYRDLTHSHLKASRVPILSQALDTQGAFSPQKMRKRTRVDSIRGFGVLAPNFGRRRPATFARDGWAR